MKIKRWIYDWVPLIGILFCFLYLNRAVIDVAYTDYIRLINAYLPDVWNPQKFFVADVLTRIPLNYVERIVNVTFFGYNTVVEMALGVLGLGASAWVLASYCKKQQFSLGWYLSLMFLLFGLNKWEMLTNGTGWVHFAAFACFYYHYTVLDRVYRQEARPHDKLRMCLLPFAITLGVAGPYCAVYSAVLILACLWTMGLRLQRAKSFRAVRTQLGEWLLYLLCALLPLLLYMWSNAHTVEEHAGAVDASLVDTLLEQPLFFVQFFFSSFASTVLGDECIRQICQEDGQIVLLGVFVVACYVFALVLNLRYRLYERTLLPLLLLAAGGMNHVLILLSRWIFMNVDYGMSSRYALQFQVGIFGILLTFACLKERVRKTVPRRVLFGVAVCITAVFLAGNSYTGWKEWEKAPYRKNNLIEKREAALRYEEWSDEELETIFQYKKGPEQIRRALGILKENHWNVFRE
ncbi:MAG: hypothetical protein Q4D90_01225 [bacterium]|nr:hypothetical protein [bacterium]